MTTSLSKLNVLMSIDDLFDKKALMQFASVYVCTSFLNKGSLDKKRLWQLCEGLLIS